MFYFCTLPTRSSQIRNLKNIIDNQSKYRNKILESVAERHKISVAMLTYIYESDFNNAQIWDLLEDYFLGKIPAEVKSVLSLCQSSVDFT